MTTQIDREIEELQQPQVTVSEKVVDICRVAKVIKGGRHLSFRALVVVGNGQGRVGAAIGKADAIPDAVRKATTAAQRSMTTVAMRGTTIPYEVRAKYGAAMVLLKPARAGTGIIAGPSMRAVLSLAGVKDVVAKSLKSQNPINVVTATLEALRQLQDTRQKTPAPARGSGPEKGETSSSATPA